MRFVGRGINVPDNRLTPDWRSGVAQAMQRHGGSHRNKPVEPTIDDTDPTARAKAAAWQQGIPYQPEQPAAA